MSQYSAPTGLSFPDHRNGSSMAQGRDTIRVSYASLADIPVTEAFTEALVKCKGRTDKLAEYIKAFNPSK